MSDIPKSELDRLSRLDAAVRKMLAQRGDDICWRDLYAELASLVGIDFCPQLICEPDKFIANCRTFDKSLREGGAYEPVYVEKSSGWHTVKVVADVDTQFGILSDKDGVLEIVARHPDKPWPEIPESGINIIAPGHTRYVVASDE